MKQKHILSLIFGFCLVVFSCSNPSDSEDSEEIVAEESETIETESEMLARLLEQSLTSDSVQAYSTKPFMFFKTGHLLDLTFQNSLVLTCPTDSTFALRMFKKIDSAWILEDSLGGMKADKAQFYIESKDFNFDSQADFYIQYAYTSGYPISIGHIVLIDPKTKKMKWKSTYSRLGNANAQPESKMLRSEAKYKGPSPPGTEKIWVKRSRWMNDELVDVDSVLQEVGNEVLRHQ